MSDVSVFECPSCGRPLVWLDRLAGQRVRCACGGFTKVPPAATGSMSAADQAAAAAAPARAPTLPYASPKKAAVADADSASRRLFWPGILASAGFILTIIYYATTLPLPFPTAMMVMAARLTIDFVLLFAGCLLAMKLLDIALGEPLEAIVKLLGVALLPAAIEGLIGAHFPGGFILGWALSLGLYGVLLMWFFDLNGKEMIWLTTIVWLVQSWAGLVISALLLPNVLGAKLPMNGPLAWVIGDGDSTPDTPAGKNDAAAEALLDQPNAAEGNSWLLTGDRRSIAGRDHQQSLRLVGQLYNAKSPGVHLAAIKAGPEGEVAHVVIAELPEDAPDRAKLAAIANEAAGNPTPLIDAKVDQKYLMIDLAPEKR